MTGLGSVRLKKNIQQELIKCIKKNNEYDIRFLFQINTIYFWTFYSPIKKNPKNM